MPFFVFCCIIEPSKNIETCRLKLISENTRSQLFHVSPFDPIKSLLPTSRIWKVCPWNLSSRGWCLGTDITFSHGCVVKCQVSKVLTQASLEARGFTVASHWLQSLKMKTLLTWRKLLCRTCHRWRCLMMTRVSGRCKAMPRKFSLAPWLRQMTRHHFLKSRASVKDIIHCSIAIESHCRISSSILFLALFSIKLEHDLIADIWWFDDSWCIRIANLSHLCQGYTWSVRRLSLSGAMLPEKNERLGGDWQGSIRLFRGASSGPCYHSYCCKSTRYPMCDMCADVPQDGTRCSKEFLLCIAQRQLICSSARHRCFDCVMPRFLNVL